MPDDATEPTSAEPAEPEPTEQWRPILHFAPQRNWMNDPNGLIKVGDTYHLFFQHNPNGPDWGDISWGHATSMDLLTWEELPVAIPARPNELIFSGSAVRDEGNTSGLGADGRDPVIAIFTSDYRGHPEHGDDEAQSIAVSQDDARTFAWYPGNPVSDRGRADYRDPKVFRWGGAVGHWVMVAVEADAGRLVINVSDDLIRWEEASAFTSPHVVGIWECPDLFPLLVDGDPAQEAWVLHLSSFPAAQSYLVGDFDGRAFVARGDAHRSELGRDQYAAVTFAGIPDRRVMLGWMGQAFAAPTSPWRGIMTLPRELSLETIDGEVRLVQRFARELEARSLGHRRLDGTGVVPEALPRACRIRCAVDGDAELVLRGTRVRIEAGELVVDRSESGLVADPVFFEPTRVRLAPGPVELDIVLDAMSIEIVAGPVLMSELVFPDAGARTLSVSGAVSDLRIDAFSD